MNPFICPFDYDTATKTNVLISGTNSTGKTRLACGICSLLQNENWLILVFDSSGVWKETSDLPTFIEVQPRSDFYEIPDFTSSLIFDISDLVPDNQKRFVDATLHELWRERDNHNTNWCLVALEESHLYCKNTRGRLSQHFLRMFSVGRNRQVRVLAVTVDLALIDPSFIRLCQLRYHGRLGIEANSKRRFRQYYGKEWTAKATKLKTGQFIHLHYNELRQITVPLFQTKRLPQPYTQSKPQKKGFWERILG